MTLIAVIEDEQDILDVLAYNLSREGFDVVTASKGDEGLKLIREKKPDLILLDIMMPGIDGLEVCKQLRKDTRFEFVPIIMLTAKAEESDMIVGLGLGADDYMAKPFSQKELLARVKAKLRSAKGSNQAADKESALVINVDGLTIDSARHKVKLDGKEVSLTASEFRLLLALASKSGRVLSREQLLGFILTDHAVVVDRNVDVHIRAVRKKIGSYAHLIETVRGVGYRFKESG